MELWILADHELRLCREYLQRIRSAEALPGIFCRAGEAAHIQREGAVDPVGWHGAGAEKLERIRGDEL